MRAGACACRAYPLADAEAAMEPSHAERMALWATTAQAVVALRRRPYCPVYDGAFASQVTDTVEPSAKCSRNGIFAPGATLWRGCSSIT